MNMQIVEFTNLYSLNLAITLQQQPKTFAAQKVKTQLIPLYNPMVQEILFWIQNHKYQAESGRLKTMNSKAMLLRYGRQMWRVSGELGISLLNIFFHFHDISKSIQSCWIVSHVTKILQNFWLNLVHDKAVCHFYGKPSENAKRLFSLKICFLPFFFFHIIWFLFFSIFMIELML